MDKAVGRLIGIIGSGKIGGAIARLCAGAGLDVVVSNSRGPETLAELVADLGDRARAATPAEAAQAADLVVVSVPLHAYEQLPVDALGGKIVIDVTNYYPDRDGQIPELDSDALTSSGFLQRHLAKSRVVKTFNNIVFTDLLSLARPRGAPDRSALPVAGDDADAKAEVVELLDLVGYDAVDIGGLGDSWRTEPGSPAYVHLYLPEMPEGMDREEAMRWYFETPGVPVPADRLGSLVESAVRGAAGGGYDKA